MAMGGKVRGPTVAVVTATTGRDTLQLAIDSVADQLYPCTHYVFSDNADLHSTTKFHPNTKFCRLPVKTGGNGMMNGGIVAASAYLVQEDCIAWLDDDNWFEPNHIKSLVDRLEDLSTLTRPEYAYSLRKLVNVDGSFFDNDDCESLGPYTKFIDLNCYLMRRQLAVQIAPLWYNTTGTLMVGDRHVYNCLDQNKLVGVCNGEYSVNYRLSMKNDLRAFFFENNVKVRAQFAGKLPWERN
jgi:glycosyltransferase involved in cell wall biosynthesis